jgi:hypothetical protein
MVKVSRIWSPCLDSLFSSIPKFGKVLHIEGWQKCCIVDVMISNVLAKIFGFQNFTYGTVLTVGRQNYLILVSEKFCHFRHLVRLYFDIIHTTYVKYRLSYPYQIMYVGKICSIFSENRRRPSLLKTNC